MKKLNAQWERTEGTVINFYNIGDYANSVPRPSDNELFPEAMRASDNPKHVQLMDKSQKSRRRKQRRLEA